MLEKSENKSIRLDLFLFYIRIFKSRNLASKFINGIQKISKDLKLKYFSILGKRDGIIKKDQNNNLEIDINILKKIIS